MQETDFNWFLDNYDRLYKEYGDSYIVIKNCSVLGTYASHLEALRETVKTEQLGSFIVQHCNGQESGYSIYIASTNFEPVDGKVL